MKCRGEEGVLRGEVLNVWGGEEGVLRGKVLNVWGREGWGVERGDAECVRKGGVGC